MKDITYNREVLQAIKSISSTLSKQFIIRKIDNQISIKKNEKGIGMYVDFTSPVENFDFEGDVLAFADDVYADFYKYYNLFKNPTIKQDAKKLIIKEDKQTIKFSPSNPDIISNEFNGVKNLPTPTVTFNLPAEQFSYLEKMIKMVGCEEVTMTVKGKELSISLNNNVNENSSDMTIELDEEIKKDLKFTIPVTIFSVAPDFNYVVNIIPEAKMFHFSSVNELFTLNVYTGIKIS